MHNTIVLASNNSGKLREFNDLFSRYQLHIMSQGEFSVEDAEETGLSFIENALIKARHACKKTSHPCIADDSGLAVDSLQGAPGIYSARYAGEHGNDQANNQKLLNALEGQPEEKRSAQFICALAFMRHADDPTPIVCQAQWQGRILTAPRGELGFGYDPLFWVPEKNCAAAELSKDIKNTLSHRAKALQLLLHALKEHGLLSAS
jgi:XTP/dITP diphosphohydrolase